MYRYTDENGQIVISSTIPQEATKRGYDILSNNGRVIETIPPAPTEEEIAAREAEKQRQKELAEQREQDRALLKRFSHPDQAVKAMHRKVRELEGLIQLKRGNISVISSQLDNEQSRAANMERAGREIPEGTLEKIRRLEAQIRDIEREIASQTQEIDELRKAFEDDIERLEEVTGEARTLPLDHTKTDN
jgi:predicted RNase H-like nuclease (RuvC/YqgF family)